MSLYDDGRHVAAEVVTSTAEETTEFDGEWLIWQEMCSPEAGLSGREWDWTTRVSADDMRDEGGD